MSITLEKFASNSLDIDIILGSQKHSYAKVNLGWKPMSKALKPSYQTYESSRPKHIIKEVT